ncbi:MAG: 50S ribosomal protein L10 [Promethearchaeota archaeon]|nr:MAG: 50S ribosomal protein L10 [Candidatus Lokiarchaeota archaeon]
MIKQKEVPQWKIEEVEKLYKLFKKYTNVIVVSVSKIGDRQIQAMRKKLRGKAVIRMSKKNLLTRAIDKYEEETGKENLDKLKDHIVGQSSLAFTDMDVFELKRIFVENKWMVAAKPGQTTPVDIWVPKGDTGLPTGQVISELNMILKLPTQIQNDTIWVREDTRTHKAGEIVDIKEAAVLKKLGVEPIESIIQIEYAWEDGEVIPKDVIYMDMDAFKQELIQSFSDARNLAIGLGVIDTETFEILIQKSYREALALLFEMPIFAEDMTEEYIRKAISNANMINFSILGEGPAPEEKIEESTEETEEEEEEEEEDEPQGIGGLFG